MLKNLYFFRKYKLSEDAFPLLHSARDIGQVCILKSMMSF